MRTLLVFPPASDPAHPPAGLAALAGYLRQRGEEVRLLDLNLLAYLHLLSSESVARFSEVLRQRLEDLEALPALQATDLDEYRSVAESLLSSDFLIEHVDDALARLRQPATYVDRRAYGEVSSIVRRAMQFVSAAHFPSEWCPGGLTMRHRDTRSADVLAAARDHRQNPFLRFFEAQLPLIRDARPDLVGISLNYHCQMIPAMTLAAIVRRHLPETPIVVGGGLVGFFSSQWDALAPFRDLVDAWIPFEGEIPLYELTQALEAAGATSPRRGMCSPQAQAVAGVLRFDGPSPVYRAPMPAPELDTLPPPSFEGLPLHDYLAPEPILPVLASRGCYWARCAFCSHGQLYRGRFRGLSASQVQEMVEWLSRQYDARCFYFVDEAMPPPLACRLAEAIDEGGLPFTWFTEARLEPFFERERLAAMARGGCRMLMFGLESGVSRVLDRMDKGIRPEIAARILDDCSRAGIRSFVMFFVGFPTETPEEARETIAFVDSFHDRISHAAFTQFVLDRHAPVFDNPERYGIVDRRPFAGEDLKTWWQFTVKEGLTPEAAGELVTEIRRHPRIRPRNRAFLVSRSHLAFLPPGPDAPIEETNRGRSVPPPEDGVPVRRPGLVPHVLAFNLDEVNESLARARPGPVASRLTHYVFDAEREVLLEVGPDGVEVLRACNGTFSVGQILEAVGTGNREATLEFLVGLQSRDFIEWGMQP